MKQFLTALAFVFGISSAAQAGILIEPYLGYEMGNVKSTSATPGSAEETDTANGVGYGLRLGYKFLIPWVALDYTAGSGKTKDDAGVESDATKSALGAVVGANLPLVRFWAGYGFSNTLTFKETAGDTKFKGTYTKVGLGFGFIPFVSLNAEYIINNYNKIELPVYGERDKSEFFSSLKHDAVFISISAPFNL